MPRLQGSLLVASPHLPDPNFYRSVVLMVEHVAEGALGLILNRMSSAHLRSVWDGEDAVEALADDCLFVGGPVDGPLMALHGNAELEGVEVVPHLYFSSETAVLDRLVQQDEIPFRIFQGYSGWGAGQLEHELQLGGWLTTKAEARHAFADVDRLWQQVTHAIGAEITVDALKLRHIPPDPRVN